MKPTHFRTTFALLAVLAAGCAGDLEDTSRPPGVVLGLQFRVIELEPSGGFDAQFTLANEGSEPLESGGWAMYFSFNQQIEADGADGGVTFEHLNGDFWRMTPTPSFRPLPPGEVRALGFEGGGWLLKESSAPAGPYFVFDREDEERVVEPSSYELMPWPPWSGGGPDVPAGAPTAASRFEQEESTTELDLGSLPAADFSGVVPTPLHVTAVAGDLSLDASWAIAAEPGLEREARHVAAALGSLLNAELATAQGLERRAKTVVLRLGEVPAPTSSGAESYVLSALPGKGIEIVGSDPAGVFYGTQTLLALLPVAAFQRPMPSLPLAAVTIVDRPRFAYRGLHLDVARNFQSRATVEKLLDAMAFYKLNRFHFHLTDDEGWRLEIDGLPELTTVGSRRGHTLDDATHLMPSFGSGPDTDAFGNHGTGHYSRADFVGMLRHATARHIEVVPEIDVPGHARAAIRAMETRAARLESAGRAEEASAFRLVDPADSSQYRSVQGWNDNVLDVCLESTYSFLEVVFADLVAMYEEAGAPLTAIHIGGDEVPAGVWQGSPACENLIAKDPALSTTDELAQYFLRRVGAMNFGRGLVTAGWEEVALRGVVHGGPGEKKPNHAFLDRRFRPYVWNNVWGWGAEDLGYRLANAGYEVVLANATNLYFDLAYDRDPREVGYTWAGTVDTKKVFEFTPLDVFRSAGEDRLGHPLDAERLYSDRVRLSAAGRSRIVGIQGQLWGENAKGSAALESMAFPKLIALAERAWAVQPAWARAADPEVRANRRAEAWSLFANVLGQREMPRLDGLFGGFAYRLPPPGAVIENGMLRANVRYPGLEIRFTTDGTEPAADSTLYEAPVAVAGPVLLRVFDGRGRGSLTTRSEP
jgi:hexosaminidase